jgi:D-xylose transport system substrate-binding protein
MMIRAKFAAVVAASAIALAACNGSGTPGPSTGAGGSGGPTGSGLSAASFDATFGAMAQLTSITSAGHGLVGVILPDTTSSARYTSYDLPYLKKAFDMAGYAATDYKIDNAAGTTTTELAIAQADISAGAKVLLVDPIDSTTGNQIQAAAAAAGIPMISYDRATFQGTTTYYVSFDNVQVGELIGMGFKQCVTDWAVSSPKVFTVDGGQDTDPNAIDFAKGYNDAVWGQKVAQVAAGATNNGMTLVGEQLAPGWDNAKGGTIFQQAYTAHPEINATIEANDGLAGAVITALKAAGVPAKKIPTTGQDATLQGMEYVLQGWQCGSVYKPVYIEAQAAVALATYLRAGQTPPASLLNGSTTDPKNSATTEPAVLLTPYWVNAANMESTVIADQFVKASDLCAAVTADVCTAAGIH